MFKYHLKQCNENYMKACNMCLVMQKGNFMQFWNSVGPVQSMHSHKWILILIQSYIVQYSEAQ